MLSGFFPTVIHLPAIHHCKGKRQEIETHVSGRSPCKLSQEYLLRKPTPKSHTSDAKQRKAYKKNFP
jgi:hypothetical protein